jgi:hypothetical protein
MRAQSERDIATVAIFGALLVFGAVLFVGIAGAVLAHWLIGTDVPRVYLTGLVVVGAVAAGLGLARATRRS